MEPFTIKLTAMKQLDLARLFGKNERTIQRWGEAGLPRHGEGRGCTYVWSEVLEWWAKNVAQVGPTDDTLTHKERLTKAQADKAELELALQYGTLLEASRVADTWAEECAAMRSRLLSIPSAAALKIDSSHGQAQREAIIREEVYEALEALSGDRRD